MSVRSPSAVTGTIQIPVAREGSFWTAPVWTPERVSSLRSARPLGIAADPSDHACRHVEASEHDRGIRGGTP